jgi:hypothetical protein
MLPTLPNVKANLILGPRSQTEFFANFGTGFHSNDARAVVADRAEPALPTALGYEFGVRSKVIPRTEFSLTYWVLNLASELVFVGDEGTTEASGPSHRAGIEFAMPVKILDWLSFSGDMTASRAEFDNGDAVALAPRLTARADLTARLPWGPLGEPDDALPRGGRPRCGGSRGPDGSKTSWRPRPAPSPPRLSAWRAHGTPRLSPQQR